LEVVAKVVDQLDHQSLIRLLERPIRVAEAAVLARITPDQHQVVTAKLVALVL